MTERNNPLLDNQSPWINNSNSIWLGSTLSLTRNLEKFKFPGKLPADKRKQIISLVSKELLASEWLKKPQLLKAEEMAPLEKEFLVEHFLSHQSFQQAYSGEAFILDESGEFLAVLNLRDHIVLEWIDIKEDLERTWDRLVKMETDLNKTIRFAFTPRFGFLTSDPAECGTGLFVYSFLHLAGLIYTQRLEEVMRKYKEDAIALTGLQGDPKELVGDIVAFHNNYTLGLSEENIVSSLRAFTTKVLVEEKSARNHLKQENNSEIKDKVSRAFGVLLHSYQIEAVEALHALSLLKLGLDLDWLSGTNHADLNRLFFDTRRAHLLCQCGNKANQEEVPHKRAEFIHQALKGVTLHI